MKRTSVSVFDSYFMNTNIAFIKTVLNCFFLTVLKSIFIMDTYHLIRSIIVVNVLSKN